MDRHLANLDGDILADVYRHWAGDIGVPTGDRELVRRELARLMSDPSRVRSRYEELAARCRDLLVWMLDQDEFAVPCSRLDEGGVDLPLKPMEVDGVVMALRARGFLAETRDRSWMHYNEPVYRVPLELAQTLRGLVKGRVRPLESQIGLRAHLRTVDRRTLMDRLRYVGLPPALAADRSSLVTTLAENTAQLLAAVAMPETREAATLAVTDHGGIIEQQHLDRLGFEGRDAHAWRGSLEKALLGTLTDGDLSDVGLRLRPGSLVIFSELARATLQARTEVTVSEAPEPLADILADLSAVRAWLDHHKVKIKRNGTLYRATARKMQDQVLSPGARPLDGDAALAFLLRFVTTAELARRDEDGLLRVAGTWKDFDSRGPVDKTDLLLTYVSNDLRGTRTGFHQRRLRRTFLAVLRDAGPGRWLDLRVLALLARNRYLQSIDRALLADRFQKRYKFSQVPPLAGPAALVHDLVQFGGEALSMIGVVQYTREDGDPAAVRLTRMGAAVLGLPVEGSLEDREGSLIVTADFEIVLFPEAGGIELVHEIGRFARREKADYTIHYRISKRSIQEAVVAGLVPQEILETLRRHGRHELPQSVAASIEDWAGSVSVLEARRVLVLKAPSAEALERVLRLKEVRAVVGERLNETMVELTEDPSTPRIADALREAGFFLRS